MLITIIMVALIATTMMMNAVKIDPREPIHNDTIGKFHAIITKEPGFWNDVNLNSEIAHRIHQHSRNFKSEDYSFRRKFMELLYEKPWIEIDPSVPPANRELRKLVSEDIDYFCWMVEEQLAIEEIILNNSECTCTPNLVCKKHIKQHLFEAQLKFDLEDLRKEKTVLLKEMASIDERILDLERTLQIQGQIDGGNSPHIGFNHIG
jgi:hypothetical protein